MEVHDIIEEVDEDKNNNNTNLIKSGKYNNEENNNVIKDNNPNIKIIKEDNNEEKENKKGNRFYQMYKSLALAKEKNKNKINIIANEFYNNAINGNTDFKNKSNNNESSPMGKQNSKLDYMSKINLPLLYKPQNISSKNKFSNNFINETPSTSAYTNSTKNNLRNDHNLTEQVSKFRIGLFSANSSSNFNAIIPILPINRPVSNLNFGGNQLWEKDDGNKNNKKNSSNEILLEKQLTTNKEQKNKNISLNKFFESNKTRDIFKSSDSKYKSISSNNRIENMNNNLNNNFKTKTLKFGKEKGQDNLFNKKLIEFKKMTNHFNKNNNFFLSRNGNKSHSVKKFM